MPYSSHNEPTVFAPQTAQKGAESPVSYRFPALELLECSPSEKTVQDDSTTQKTILEVLENAGLKAEIRTVHRGASVCRYDLAVTGKVTMRRLEAIEDELFFRFMSQGKIRLTFDPSSAAQLRIELPKEKRSVLSLRGLLEEEAWNTATSALTVALGRDLDGAPVLADLSKLPHLLIAGCAGSGRTVMMDSLLLSLLYRNTPEQLRLLLIDPTQVEFASYNNLPHLLLPVIHQCKQAVAALNWVVAEMDRRYALLASVGARDLKGYNRLVNDHPPAQALAPIVIAINELDDLMLVAFRETEDVLCRIAQKGRAAGIHLVLSVQNTQKKVFTPLLKANIPSRLSLKLITMADSKTVLDCTGAEGLLDKGDALYLPVGAMTPLRLQGAYISYEEVQRVTDFLRQANGPKDCFDEVLLTALRQEAAKKTPKSKTNLPSPTEEQEGEDPLLNEAIELAFANGSISTSILQRRLTVGYGRAAKLIDRMEQMGIIGPPEGQKPRTVLIDAEKWAKTGKNNL